MNPVYLHLGLGKAASTYLQYSFFPKLEGIEYLQRTRYFESPKIIPRLRKKSAVLVSREFDQQLEKECRWFTSEVPESRAIVVLRRHDGWIASQYRRHIKNGSPLSFQEFFDPVNNAGLWKHKELEFYHKLEMLEEIFGSAPLVLFHEELKTDPWRFFDRIVEFTGATYQQSRVDLNAVHRSYNEKQLKFIRAASGRWFPEPIQHEKVSWWSRRSRLWSCYAVLYSALLMPDRWTPDREKALIEPEMLELIRVKWAEDWQRCRDYAAAQQP